MALDKVFASASDEDARRAQQASNLDSVIAGPAQEIANALKDIGAAAEAARKALPLRKILSDDATQLHIALYEGRARSDAANERLEKTFYLGNQNYGHSINVTFRDNGTMKIEQELKHYVPATDKYGNVSAIFKTDKRQVYDGAIDVGQAQKEIGVFLSLAMKDGARQKLQTALAAITPSSGSSPRPQV
jgi:hypothetical protein